MEVVEPNASHVHHGGREDMGVSQCTLLRQRCLNTLLEGATIRDTTEDAGDELRVIHVAEAEEHLIRLAKVHVHAGIEGIPMLVQGTAAGEVARNGTSGRG